MCVVICGGTSRGSFWCLKRFRRDFNRQVLEESNEASEDALAAAQANDGCLSEAGCVRYKVYGNQKSGKLTS